MSIEAKIRATFIVSALGFLAALGLGYKEEADLQNKTRWVQHTAEVEKSLAALLVGVADLETYARGYAATENPDFVAPALAAAADLPGQLERLAALVRDNPRQLARLRALGESISSLVAYYENWLVAADARAAEAMRARLMSGEAKHEMDVIRARLAEMRDEEEALLLARSAAETVATERLRLVGVSLIAPIVALLAGSYALIRRDIAERARADERQRLAAAELRRANAFLDAVIENIPNMIFVKDAERLAFVRFNLAGERLLGVPRDLLIGKTDFDFFDKERAEFFQAKDRAALASGFVDIPEERIDTARGPRWLHTMKVPLLDEKGRPIMLLGISEDITERREIEAKIRRAKEAAEATSRELEAFSYSVSHDLRAPLRSIDGFSQALVEDYGDKFDGQGRDYLERIRAATQRMGQLIDDLLSLSQVARWDFKTAEVDLSALGQEIVADLRRYHSGREVTVHIAPGLRAVCDERLMRIALENLLGNAWKFTAKREGALIELVPAEANAGAATFCVRDNGAGFDMAYVDKLFGAFQRLHKITDFEGTGIGLATVQRIIQRHGGRVWAKGEVAKGAEFYFTLPGERGAADVR